MKRILLCLSLLLTLGLLTSCGSKDQAADTSADVEATATTNQYDSRSVNFSYPEGWVLRESDTPVGRVIILYAPESETGVQTNLNIIQQDLSASEETPTLESYTQVSKDSLSEIVEGLKVLNEGQKEIAGKEGFQISYKGATKNAPDKKFQWWQAWTVVGSKAYIFTLTGSPDSIADYVEPADAVIKSFSIK